MKNKFAEGLYFRIYLSNLYSYLKRLDELYSTGEKKEYLLEMKRLLSALQAMPSDKNSAVAGLYSTHVNLIQSADRLAQSQNVEELNKLTASIRRFIDDLSNALLHTNSARKIKPILITACLLSLALIGALAYAPAKQRYVWEREQNRKEKELYDYQAKEPFFEDQTIEDIRALKDAIDKYYLDHKSYPKSSGGWDAIAAAWGQSTENWIPGLAPKYIKTLPTDPRKSKEAREQYMYRSDGKDFKLIAHNPAGIEDIVKTHPGLVDPARPSWAMGVWSENAKNW